MKINVYAIKDAKAGIFHPPFFSQNHATATRSANHSARDAHSLSNSHPEDFAIYHIGTFDDESGKLSVMPTPDFVSNISIPAAV